MTDLALLRELRRLGLDKDHRRRFKRAAAEAYAVTADAEYKRAKARLAVGLPVDASDEELVRTLAERSGRA